ncbi:hypothetical protein Tco_0563437 [Tanacetum coccineum]
MATPDLNGTRTTPCLADLNPAEPNTNKNVKIEISKEILVKLRNNAYNRAEANDAVDYITRFLQIIDLVKISNVNQKQLCIFAFPYSLTGGARRWWMHEGNDKITSWVELIDKFFYKYYPLSYASRTNDANDRESYLKFMDWLSSKFKNPWKLNSVTKNALWNFWEKGYDDDTLIDDEESSDDESDKSNLMNHQDTNPFFDPYLNAKDEGNKSHHMKVDKFEVIKYSIGDNKEFMGIRTLKRDSWAQTVNGISNIYLDIFRKKDEGIHTAIAKVEIARTSSKFDAGPCCKWNRLNGII